MNKVIEISLDDDGEGCQIKIVRGFDFDSGMLSGIASTLIYTMMEAVPESEREQLLAEVATSMAEEFESGAIESTYVVTEREGAFKVMESDKDGKRYVFEGTYHQCEEYCKGLDMPQSDEEIGFYTDGKVSYQIMEE